MLPGERRKNEAIERGDTPLRLHSARCRAVGPCGGANRPGRGKPARCEVGSRLAGVGAQRVRLKVGNLAEPGDYDRLHRGDVITLDNLHSQLRAGGQFRIEVN